MRNFKDITADMSDNTLEEVVSQHAYTRGIAIVESLHDKDTALYGVLEKLKATSMEALNSFMNVDLTTEKGVKDVIRHQQKANEYFGLLKHIKELLDAADQAEENLSANVVDDDAETELRNQQHGRPEQQHFEDS